MGAICNIYNLKQYSTPGTSAKGSSGPELANSPGPSSPREAQTLSIELAMNGASLTRRELELSGSFQAYCIIIIMRVPLYTSVSVHSLPPPILRTIQQG